MRRQLIVVVHGVGVRQAGSSTDMLASALASELAADRDSDRYEPHSSDDFHLHEAPRYAARGGLRRTFPARLRRFRRYGPPPEPQAARPVLAERVMADFYWGDISATGADLPRLALGLVRVVLGLAHVIRESAAAVFPGPGRADTWARRLAVTAPLILHGPILAINLLLLLGFMAHLVLVWALADCAEACGCAAAASAALAPWSAGLSGVLAIGGALWRRLHARAFLERLLWTCVALGGLAVVLMGVAGKLRGTPAGHLDQARWLLMAMFAAWALAYLAAGAAGAWAAWRRHRVAGTPPPLVLQGFALMTCLWFAILTAIWALLLQALDGSGLLQPDRAAVDLIRRALTGVLPALGALILLGVIGAAVHGSKRARAQLIPPAADPDRRARLWELAERGRLILSPWLGVVLILFLAVSVYVAGLMQRVGPFADPPDPGVAQGLSVWDALTAGAAADWRHLRLQPPPMLVELTGWALAILAVVAAALTVWLRAAFAQGLAIVTDIVVWLNDRSFRLARTADAAPAADYWARQRILDRLNVLMTTLLRDEDPHEVVLVAHSQGTMIALAAIAEHGATWSGPPGRTRRLTLVTMGSPYRHLYRHYFPQAWPSHRAVPALRPVEQDGLLDDWLNIFRIDDFVGTQIDPPGDPAPPWPRPALARLTWPAEHPVPPNGHTNYWLDPAVFAPLAAALAPRPEGP